MRTNNIRHESCVLKANLSNRQATIFEQIRTWLHQKDKPVFHLDGVASSGKTLTAVTAGLEFGAQFAAPTAKAALVLRERGAQNAATLHHVLYGAPTIKLLSDGSEELLWTPRADKKIDFIVADECSQIDQKLGRDLMARGVKILVTGDAHQLPPVVGKPFFDGVPDFTLSEVHRQALNSQPLRWATRLRNGGQANVRRYDLDQILGADAVICALNKTRRRINRAIRKARGLGHQKERDLPVVGDLLVCLRNNYARGVLNGSLWTVNEIARRSKRKVMGPFGELIGHDIDLLDMTLVDDFGTEVRVAAAEDVFFTGKTEGVDRQFDLFDFGYALTAHKAQGSEWDRVVVIDETGSPGFKFIAGEHRLEGFKACWLYTAITRAKSRMTVMEAG